MPGSHNPVLAAIGAAVLGVSLAAGGGAAQVSSGAVMSVAQMTYDPAPVVPDPNAQGPQNPQNPLNLPLNPPTALLGPILQKVSANTAGEDVIATALQAAGVASPKRWAAEVVEYRPYPAGDLALTKLRQNLAKYNPAQQTVDQIVSALRP